MKKYLIALIIILLFLAHQMTAEACQDLNPKELKTFKDKNGVDLNQPFALSLSSQMTPPMEIAARWDRLQRKKWQILLPVTRINEFKVTEYRSFTCTGNVSVYYPCTKALYQLRLQLNPKESCQSVQSDAMSINVLAVVDNKVLRILDLLPNSLPLGLLVLEDIENTKKEPTKVNPRVNP